MFGRSTRSPQALLSDHAPLSDELTPALLAQFRDRVILPTASRNLSDYQARYKTQFDANHRPASFSPGDRVLAQTERRSSKADPAYIGPFVVRRVTTGGSIELSKDDAPDAIDPPPRRFSPRQLRHLEADLTSPPGHYEVDYIYGHRINRGKLLLHVHWRGYHPCEDSWEPIKNFPDKSILQA
ncbi:hypothetical protein IWQ56_007199, partial [Coemansia nantahalensis]